MALSDEAILLLTKLDQARADADASDEATEWVNLENYTGELIGAMKRNKYIEERVDSLPVMYRITDKGHDALMKELAAPQGKQKKRAKVAPLYENGNGNGNGLKPVVNEPVRPFAELMAEACRDDGCATCVYRQAVEILAARVPGTNELVDALKLLNKAR